MKHYITSKGYARVNLRYAHSRDYKSFLVHRLVAGNFLPNPNNYQEVNHKDCNRINNSVDNLEWCDRFYNVKYAYNHNGIKSNTKQYHNNILADAFARYDDKHTKYNPGQKNYVQMVTNIGNEVWSDPQIRKWWDEEGFKYYKKGLNE